MSIEEETFWLMALLEQYRSERCNRVIGPGTALTARDDDAK